MMKKTLLIASGAMLLAACTTGGSDAGKVDMTTPEAQQSAMEQAQQAFQSGDKAAAIATWEAAANAGNAAAQHNLSVVYRTGDGVGANPDKAMGWLAKSAEQGYVPAVYDMGSFYLQQGDPAQAAPLMQAAAEQGYAPAQFNLGVMSVRGDGVQKNEAAGIQLIEAAAAQGFEPAVKALQGQ
ncbi:hypothetical protein L0B52_00515 [Suttonella sp. R2A3]|uniref:tetratricopeptide repeat protein n=1 Tax=Suttonella sp. R2A3 TaxID=2908648 RepID=UPI001F37C241|nr:hypothetical protein [Suttonella sp. R2A3]UJF24659.1 hypothetical protein L0B52_00515 [Suttonella sp. R2A3]